MTLANGDRFHGSLGRQAGPLRVVQAADLAGLDVHGGLDGTIPAEVIGPPSS